MRRLAGPIAAALLGAAMYAAYRIGRLEGSIWGYIEAAEEVATAPIRVSPECPICHLSIMPGDPHDWCQEIAERRS